MFEHLTPAPPDPILGLTEAFKEDQHPQRINLGVGVYQDAQGRTPVLQAVKQAEERIWHSETTKSYMPIGGSPVFGRLVRELLCGADHPACAGNRLVTLHTPGGTGALRVGADWLASLPGAHRVWVSRPTWANHRGVFEAAGFTVAEYPYQDPATHAVDFEAMCAGLEEVPAGDVVLLHVCCHNPSGADLSPAQWQVVARLAEQKGWLPFLDFAYQGLGAGIEPDRAGVCALLDAGVEMLIASSFSKNFGLYRERTGALTVATRPGTDPAAAFSLLQRVVRVNYSNPPAHGGLIVETVLGDAALRRLWQEELDGMRSRIQGMREQLQAYLAARPTPGEFGYIARHQGMFSLLGLADEVVATLRAEFGIYVVKGGRINVAALTPANWEYFAASLLDVLNRKA
ncbi:MAG: aspartate/tyrosine/aromatic aminotransferase [Candidatus Marinimicrobia bacterium]|nr:aspartate/tyrosine/aromatic aminotransferase [Candidatus Neomarinimicrobiota bacterium]